MTYELIQKTNLKKSHPKHRKNSKNREIVACGQKNTNEKANFCSNTDF